MLPHLDAAYNLARRLTGGSAQDADDAVQDGGDGRAWLLTIIRNTCYDWLRRNQRRMQLQAAPDPELQVLVLRVGSAGGLAAGETVS